MNLEKMLAKQLKDLHNTQFKTLKKNIEETVRRWKDSPC